MSKSFDADNFNNLTYESSFNSSKTEFRKLGTKSSFGLKPTVTKATLKY